MKTLIQRWREESRVFLFYFRKYRRFYVYGILSLVVVDGLEAFPPLLLKSAVDELTLAKFGAGLNLFLLKLLAAYMAIACVQGLMRFFWRKYIIRTSMLASHDMRDELFTHLTSLPNGFFQKRRVGELVSLSTNDIEAMRFALGPGALTLFDAIFYFLTIPPIMLWISPRLTILAFLPLFLVPFFVRKMEALIQKRYREVQDRFAEMASNCQEALGGVRIVKGSALESFKEREFDQMGEKYRQANMKAAVTQSTLSAGLDSVLSASTTILFLAVGAYVMQEKVTLGVFVAFQRYIQKLSWPMESIGLAANIFQRSMASQKRVDEVLAEKPQAEPALPVRRPRSGPPAISVRNLSYTHPGAITPSLKNISFDIKAGKKLGIAGGIGSGKSTLLACLARTVTVPRGTIFIDSIDVNDLPLNEFRQDIAFVPQETFLFSRSITDNILYGADCFESQDQTLRLEVARKAARLAAVDGDALRLPQGYETLLGERGTNISGGQRQRFTIARAIARKPQLLLLDDCMSAIDAETEKKLIDGILEAASGISLIVASHRVSSFDYLDWVLVLDQGNLAGFGPPSELKRSNQTLAELARKQELEGMDLLR
jgi:ATP-binding cassette subfamily B multidrug efflux pump